MKGRFERCLSNAPGGGTSEDAGYSPGIMGGTGIPSLMQDGGRLLKHGHGYKSLYCWISNLQRDPVGVVWTGGLTGAVASRKEYQRRSDPSNDQETD